MGGLDHYQPTKRGQFEKDWRTAVS